MILGEIPGLASTGPVWLFWAPFLLVATEQVSPGRGLGCPSRPTIALLFGLMVVSAQLRMAGFYTAVARRLAAARGNPAADTGRPWCDRRHPLGHSANDIVCLAMAPVLVEGVTPRRGLDPRPFLLGLACAANVARQRR